MYLRRIRRKFNRLIFLYLYHLNVCVCGVCGGMCVGCVCVGGDGCVWGVLGCVCVGCVCVCVCVCVCLFVCFLIYFINK